MAAGPLENQAHIFLLSWLAAAQSGTKGCYETVKLYKPNALTENAAISALGKRFFVLSFQRFA
ncbi:MAG: hypothetical protein WCA08_16225 [Desulfoferrobacter sp.]